MRTATVIVAFHDLQEGVLRLPGDTFQAEEERAKQLEELGFVNLDKRKKTVRK